MSGNVKITIDVEINETLIEMAKEAMANMPKMMANMPKMMKKKSE